MSKFVIYVHFEPFVKQWLVNSYGNPVEFPSQSVENATIRRFTVKQPDVVVPHEEDDLAIFIPDSKAKDPMIYNHLTKHGKKAVIECVEDNFKLNMWSELGTLSDTKCKIMTCIYTWCEMHGIDIDYADTIRQRYYRIRDSYLKKGIDMRKHTKSYDRE